MNDEAPATTGKGFSNEQDIVRNVLSICSSSLSIIGSSIIVFKILRDRALNRSWTPYDRIIFGLSSCDVFASITWAIDQFLKPRETGLVWAFGNPATCLANAFLYQLFPQWALCYNSILSFYFLLTVLSQVRGTSLVRKWEPWMHLSGLYCPITAILGLHLGWFDGQSCTIFTDKPVSVIIAQIPPALTFLSLIINYTVIYVIVRKSLRSSEHVAGTTSRQTRIKREATTLMFLYVGCFFLTQAPAFVMGVFYANGFTHENDAKILYPLMVLREIFLPLQGFFNVFIFLKPAYTRFRAANPNKPIKFVLHQALFNPDVPQWNSSSDQPDSNAIAEGEGEFKEDDKKEASGINLKRKKPRKKPRNTSMDSEDDDSLSDSTV